MEYSLTGEGSITVWLTSCFTGFDSAALLCLNNSIFTCLVESNPSKYKKLICSTLGVYLGIEAIFFFKKRVQLVSKWSHLSPVNFFLIFHDPDPLLRNVIQTLLLPVLLVLGRQVELDPVVVDQGVAGLTYQDTVGSLPRNNGLEEMFVYAKSCALISWKIIG